MVKFVKVSIFLDVDPEFIIEFPNEYLFLSYIIGIANYRRDTLSDLQENGFHLTHKEFKKPKSHSFLTKKDFINSLNILRSLSFIRFENSKKIKGKTNIRLTSNHIFKEVVFRG